MEFGSCSVGIELMEFSVFRRIYRIWEVFFDLGIGLCYWEFGFFFYLFG